METLDKNYNIKIDNVSKSEWSDLLVDFDDANIYQTWSYGAVRWGEKNLSHIVLKKDGKAVGLSQVSIVKVPILGWGIAYVPWGPVWRRKKADIEIDVFRQMIKALREEYVIRRRLLLRMTPQEIRSNDNEIQNIIEAEGFEWKSCPYRTLLIDLTTSMEEIFQGTSRRWRRALKTAEQKDLEIITGTGDDLYESFKSLYDEMLERKHFVPTIDINEFQAIQEKLPEPLKMKIMICKFKGKAVSALIASLIGSKGIGLLGATGAAGMNLGSFHLLNWRMMEWMKSSGAHYYDFGGYNPDENPGTASFKDGLPGVDATHIGRFEACRSPISRWIVGYGERVRSNSINKIGFLKNVVKLS